MKKTLKYITSITLSLIFMISTMGITVSIHECDITHEKTASFVLFGQGSNDNACSACATERKNKECNMPLAKNDDSCCNDTGSNTADVIAIDDNMHCCLDFTEYVQAQFDVVLIQKSITNFKILFILINKVKLFELPVMKVFSNDYQSLDGGLSPPYASDYINFISSLLE